MKFDYVGNLFFLVRTYLNSFELSRAALEFHEVVLVPSVWLKQSVCESQKLFTCGLSDFGRFRSDLIQSSRVVLEGHPKKSDSRIV